MDCEGVLEHFEIECEVVLVFRIQVETIHVDGAGKIVIDDFAIDNAISEVFNFHFRGGFGYDLFDPVEDVSFGGHGGGSAWFLHVWMRID